jgi:glucosamine--fructose-6-phosphate aminotransferase (isomerizing)
LFCIRDELNEKTQSNAAEVAARGARLIEVGARGNRADRLDLPISAPVVVLFTQAVAVQMISYFTALARGAGIDQPKNLAKFLAVELIP